MRYRVEIRILATVTVDAQDEDEAAGFCEVQDIHDLIDQAGDDIRLDIEDITGESAGDEE